MSYKALFICLLLISFSCVDRAGSATGDRFSHAPDYNSYAFIKDIPLPEGFERTAAHESSFAFFLRHTPLKKDKTVYLFNGMPKRNQQAQFAVLNISVGERDLQQCADAVMRLRAEYFFSRNEHASIVFYDNKRTAYRFSGAGSKDKFERYLNRVFGMCGSASLAKQLNGIGDFSSIQAGDVLIRGGFPGHAALVMDVAINKTGKRIYLLAQSYMPAQDIHVLKNPAHNILSPWYEVTDAEEIITPEYVFKRTELKRW
jgi:hypothetical protein